VVKGRTDLNRRQRNVAFAYARASDTDSVPEMDLTNALTCGLIVVIVRLHTMSRLALATTTIVPTAAEELSDFTRPLILLRQSLINVVETNPHGSPHSLWN